MADDGVGGAELGDGSGIQGLTDRVGALSGSLEVESPPGEGTRVIASIPLTEAAAEAAERLRAPRRACCRPPRRRRRSGGAVGNLRIRLARSASWRACSS